MQDYMIETVEILRKDKAAYHKNREALCEVQELVAKVQEDSPQKRREFDRLTQKLTQSVQKMVQLNCTVQESQDQYDAARSDHINTALPKFQNDLVRWTETRTNSIKDMLIQLKQLEQIAVEKAEEAVNVGKDSANAIDTQESVSQFMNAAQLSLDLAVRKSSAISIRDMKMFSKAGKLYVKRSKSPLSPWCIQYSVLQENRLVLFDGPESEHPREVILLDKIPKVIATLGSAKGQQKFENDLFWHTIVNEVQYSLFQKADCFQLIFHENASVIPISLEPKVDLSDSCSISAFQENHGALEISTEPRTNGGDRSYYFIPVDPEPSKHWIKAFVENGARSCQCGKCYEHKAKLALRIWIIEGTSIGVERGTNDNLSVTIKFGKLNMAKTLFKQGPNPPQRYGLIAHDPDVATVRKLTLITKIMQHLANFSPFGVKERHMECSNDWIASNTDAMKAFLDKISSSDINSDLSAKLEVNAPDQLSTITCVHKFLSGCAPSITSTTPGILSNETWQYNMRMVDSLDLDLEAKARKGLKVLRAMTAESKQINSNIRRTIDFQKKLDHFNHSFEKKQTEFFNASQSIPNRRKEKTKHSPIRRKSRSLESFATVTRPLSLYGIQTLVKAQMDALMNPNSKATDFEIGTSSGDDSSKNAISSPDQYRQRMTKFINRFKTAPEQSSP
ncbi:RAS protein activator like-3 [Entophlyctis luteolus]|nr:RAS protein activator like-3 [Entophlyctis luteolus]